MNNLMKKAGLPDPIYEEMGSSFVVTFKKFEVKSSEKIIIQESILKSNDKFTEKVRRKCGINYCYDK